jgi:quercetin dioxygenase-like cupin family protein
MGTRTFSNPVTGERATFTDRTNGQGHALVQAEYSVQPGGGTPAHVHPGQEQRIEVVKGELHFRIGRAVSVLGPGQACTIPPGVPHAQWNGGREVVETVEQLAPPLRFEAFFANLCGLARDGKTDRRGRPSLLQSAVLFREFRDTVRLAPPTSTLMYPLFAVLAPVARALGYRARNASYEQPGIE